MQEVGGGTLDIVTREGERRAESSLVTSWSISHVIYYTLYDSVYIKLPRQVQPVAPNVDIGVMCVCVTLNCLDVM